MRRILGAVVAMLWLSATPAMAQLGIGGFVNARGETHEERGGFIARVKLYDPGDGPLRGRRPVWAVTHSEYAAIKLPALSGWKARITVNLETDDGKPVREGRWTYDQRLPLEQWQALTPGPDGLDLELNLHDYPRDLYLLHFAQAIEGGKRRYFKALGFSVRVSSKRRWTPATLELSTYDFERGDEALTSQFVVRKQLEMGAGGYPLIQPLTAGAEELSRRADSHSATPAGGCGPPGEEARQNPDSAYAEVVLAGFESWIRVEWIGAPGEPSVYIDLNPDQANAIEAPPTAISFRVFIVKSEKDTNGVQIGNGFPLVKGRTKTVTIRPPANNAGRR